MKTSLRILSGFAIVIVLMIPATGFYLSMGKKLGERHLPSGFDETFDFESSTFEQYISWSERRIRASRIDSPADEQIANLLPFILKPDEDCPVNPDGKYPNGIVIIHGLIASPWSMKPLAQHFNTRCFYVLGLLLPGHGTRPGDMLDASWEQWQQSTAFATAQISEKVDRVFLSGHSAGATMSILEASSNSGVEALILFAPALQINPASKYAGTVSLLGNIFPAAGWFEVEPDEAFYRYESFPFSAAAETWSLIQATHAALEHQPLEIPVFTVASVQDTTVYAQATFDFMAAQKNPLSFTLLYSQRNLPPYTDTLVRISNDPGQGIIGMGHLGLMTPPEHPFYGRDGDYRYCGHYYGLDNDLFDRCKRGERNFYGEPTPENLQRGLIERIAFNPFYAEMLDEIDLFIEQVNMDQKGLPIQPAIEGFAPLDLDN